MTQAYVMAILAAAGLAAACGGAPRPNPNNQLVEAQAALRAADELGADEVPQAELHTKLAEEQIELAEKSMEDGENERASRLLARARADAELAVALAKRADVSKEVRGTP